MIAMIIVMIKKKIKVFFIFFISLNPAKIEQNLHKHFIPAQVKNLFLIKVHKCLNPRTRVVAELRQNFNSKEGRVRNDVISLSSEQAKTVTNK